MALTGDQAVYQWLADSSIPMPILFDLDGTLADPRSGILASLRFAISKFERPMPPHGELESMIGPPIHSTMSALLSTSDPNLIADGVKAYRDEFSRVGVAGNVVYPGISDILRELNNMGMPLFVATSKARHFAEQIVSSHGLSSFFSGIYGSELDGTRADKAELIAHILARESISPEDCVMVGDRKHDIIGAKANGLKSIGVLWGFGQYDELEASGADWIIQSPDYLLDIVG